MKRLRFSATISVLLVVAFLTPLVLYADGEWVTVGTRGFSAGSVLYVSAAVNSANVPYVAFSNNYGTDDTPLYKAVLMRYDDSSKLWNLVGGTAVSAGAASYVSLAIGSDDVPYVAYQDGSQSDKITVRKFNGIAWETVGSAGFSGGKADYISLALDSSNVPFVAFEDYWDDVVLRRGVLKKWTAAGWEEVGPAGFSPGGADYICLALDSNNVPYIAFKDANSLDRVKKFEDGQWTEVGSPGFSAGNAYWLSLVLDSNNVPYVAYRDIHNSNRVTVKRLNGEAWELVGDPDFYAGTDKFNISLALDPRDVPYVAFQDSANASKATVMRFDGSAWQTVGTAGFSEAGADYTSLAIGSNGTLFVAYRDVIQDVSYKATVKSYTYPLAVTLVSFEAAWEVDSVSVSWETAQEVDNLGFNLYHAPAIEGPWVRLNDALIPAQNPGAVFGAVYEWVDSDVIPYEPMYYRLEDVDIHGVGTFHGPIAAVLQEPSAVTVAAFGAEGGSLALLFGLMGVALFVGRKRSRR